MLFQQSFVWPENIDFYAKIHAYFGSEKHLVVLDNRQHKQDDPNSAFEVLVATKPREIFKVWPHEISADSIFNLESFIGSGDWVVGGLAYDVKNGIEHLHSNQFDFIKAPDLFFFKPGVVLLLKETGLTIYAEEDPEVLFEALCHTMDSSEKPYIKLQEDIRPLMEEEAYLACIDTIREHILEGDLYEANFCQAFVGNAYISDPLLLFYALSKQHQAPFSCYVRCEEIHLLSASPERFLSRRGEFLTAQPIKGTRKRGANSLQDDELRAELRNSIKDQAENIMIVDLMRNDLSRCCISGSVQVEELFGIYTFNKVIQMISTIRGTQKEGTTIGNILTSTFPMGSMTGAPKIRAMERIEQYENFKRSWFSGAFGYIAPSGDFDFNVVIRSVLYREDSGQLLLPVGGAIVYDSVPEEEYSETLVKIQPIIQLIRDNSIPISP
jgi:para-aminobenzoate synthetase component I